MSATVRSVTLADYINSAVRSGAVAGATSTGCARSGTGRCWSRGSRPSPMRSSPPTPASTRSVVSNHGGRSPDYAPATVPLMAPVAEAMGGRIEIICDGGDARRGSDIVKAVAAGATAAMAGRAYLYALGAAGEAGVILPGAVPARYRRRAHHEPGRDGLDRPARPNDPERRGASMNDPSARRPHRPTRVDHQVDPLGVGDRAPCLSWRLPKGSSEAAGPTSLVATVDSDSGCGRRGPGAVGAERGVDPRVGGGRVEWRVRGLGPTSVRAIGSASPASWRARAVGKGSGLGRGSGSRRWKADPTLRAAASGAAARGGRARIPGSPGVAGALDLHVTAARHVRSVHRRWAVGDPELTPGWTAYRCWLQVHIPSDRLVVRSGDQPPRGAAQRRMVARSEQHRPGPPTTTGPPRPCWHSLT